MGINEITDHISKMSGDKNDAHLFYNFKGYEINLMTCFTKV